MFELNEDTKTIIIAYLKECNVVKDDVSDETLMAVLDNVAVIVKRQFGF